MEPIERDSWLYGEMSNPFPQAKVDTMDGEHCNSNLRVRPLHRIFQLLQESCSNEEMDEEPGRGGREQLAQIILVIEQCSDFLLDDHHQRRSIIIAGSTSISNCAQITTCTTVQTDH